MMIKTTTYINCIFPKKRGLLFLVLFTSALIFSCGSPNSNESIASVQKSTATNNNSGIVEARLQALGIQLPDASAPVSNYVNAVRTANLVFMAGKGPRDKNGNLISGKVGADLSVDEGYEAARLVAISQLAALQAEIGDLDKVTRIVKVLGMVNATSDFTQHPEVINGYSDLMVEVFGERGKHARAAVGVASLPRGIPVEIEMIVEVEE